MGVLGALLTAWPGWAGTVLDRVQSKKVVRCGVSEGIPGFSVPGADGRWAGMDADFCRAVAAAALGDPDQVAFVPLTAAGRFPALKGGRIDLLARNTTRTLGREARPGDGVRRDALLRRSGLPGRGRRRLNGPKTLRGDRFVSPRGPRTR